MRIYEHFTYTGREQRWKVPEGVTQATFECWGAAGGMPSGLAFEGKKRQVRGGTGPRNIYFFNSPRHEGQLGNSYPNNAGYARGKKNVTVGDTYFIFVGGNGGPGHSTIKLQKDGTTYSIGLRGGAGGYNGGGDGGKGAHVKQNLYNSGSHKVHYRRNSLPPAAHVGQLWYDTGSHEVKQCNTTYHSGGAANSKWDKVTHDHAHAVGPSGGGGGGATDIRYGGDALGDRILVAGGGGGAGGHWNKTGSAAWTLRQVPAHPAPPFGNDGTSRATGPDHTWATGVNYLVGGWGGGGIGGGTGPVPHAAPTVGGGNASSGGSGGVATGRHKDGTSPGHVHGSGGHGGTHVAGGSRGRGGSGGQNGSLGNGGNGANADGGWDDWCAGGGGGGGGYYGGGGGGQGFKVSGHHSGVHTRGGGGGGGSNYAGSGFTSSLLSGCARPPSSEGSHGTGANGHGGFARITYNQPPVVKWKSIPRAILGGSTFTATFDYTPAIKGGKPISHYVVGTSATPTDTFPTAETTVMVSDPTLTEFSWDFTAPASGVTEAFFVQVVDTDGDASAWLKQTVHGLSSTETSTASITAPASGSLFPGSATVDWTLGTQTPLVAYRLGVSGNDPASGALYTTQTGYRRGGSRVNLATDPGFEGSAVWSSTANTVLVSDTTYPGVSGHNGKIGWSFTDDNSAENHTTTWDNLSPGTTYRLHIEAASATSLDSRPVAVQVWDENGLLTTATIDMSAANAGVYTAADIQFTPTTQGVYFVVLPSATGYDVDAALQTWDFEDGTTGGFSTGASDGTYANSGDLSLKVTAASTHDLSSYLTGAGDYLLEAMVYVPSGGGDKATLQVAGTGVANTAYGENPTLNQWAPMRLPFTWDGAGTVAVNLNGDATGVWYDDIAVYVADNTDTPDFGNTDTWQGTFLANMLLELVYEEDGAGYGGYFDGSHLNGLTGSVSWSGTANASASYLTGTDILTGDITGEEAPLANGLLFLDTLTEGAVVNGYDGSQVSIPVDVKPSLPATPTVSLTVDSTTGIMTLAINANDGAATYKTTSFDILRNGVRIATGLTPDITTRDATYMDAPGNTTATYVVRAIDAIGGFSDQTDGTVTLVP